MIRNPWQRWTIAGLVTGVIDGLYAIVLSVGFYGSTVTRLWQNVAFVLLGKAAFEGGTGTALIGVAMHFAVAFTWSGIFLLLATRSAWIRRVLQSRGGIFKAACVYGPLVWAVMSLVVIPLLVRRPPTITVRWWIQLIGHIPFVGLPIVATIGAKPRSV